MLRDEMYLFELCSSWKARERERDDACPPLHL
jgi:hypothetical protein